jgi:hypothetical protein
MYLWEIQCKIREVAMLDMFMSMHFFHINYVNVGGMSIMFINIFGRH